LSYGPMTTGYTLHDATSHAVAGRAFV